MRPIRVWRFKDAPHAYRRLASGNDEDWVVVVPPEYGESLSAYSVPWIAATDTRTNPERHVLADGTIVFIGSHA